MDFRDTTYNQGIRQNNPGNLRTGNNWQGEAKTYNGFETFVSVEYGIRAMMINIHTWYNRGYNTIAKLITIWAPPSENKTNNYINFVSQKTGIKANAIFAYNKKTIISICKAIAQMENAPHHKVISESSYTTAWSMLPASIQKENNKAPKNNILSLLFGAFLIYKIA